MTHKKSVSDAVRAANLANAQSSTGPRTEQGKSNSSNNAVRHGILARKVVLDTEEQRAEFLELCQHCKTELRPKGLIEKFIVEEIATLLWKLGIAEFLEVRELLRRQELSDDVDSIFNEDLELPISGYDLPLDRGWDCERMVVRAVAGTDKRYSATTCGPRVFQGKIIHFLKGRENNDDHEVDHLESMTRYQAKLKRDFYRAIDTLRKMQAERREGEN
jgi:hypothetical protein